MDTKYHVGDKVVVRSDLVEDEVYYMDDGRAGDSYVYEMVNYRGEIVTISDVGDKYSIEEDSGAFWWTDEMFECLAEQGNESEVSSEDLMSLLNGGE